MFPSLGVAFCAEALSFFRIRGEGFECLVQLKALAGIDEAEKIIQAAASCSEIDRTDLDPHILRFRFSE